MIESVANPWLDALYELQAMYELSLPSAPVVRPWRSRVLVGAGVALVLASLPSVAQALVPPDAPAARPVPRAAPAISEPVATAPRSQPVRLSIPTIRLASQLVPLDLDAAGGLQDLTDFGRPGWYAGGPRPGDPGVALIVGHVDSYQGPAVFQRLEQLGAGDGITVQRSDGTLTRFVVERLASYPKDRFPTDQVFAGSAPGLRLITCFGSFDTARKSYTRNLVVYASLATPLPAQPRSQTAPHQKELQ